MGQLVEYPWNGSTAKGYLATPSSGKVPAVVVIQEWWGLVRHIEDVVERFAKEGFLAIAPDLYHGKTTKSPDTAGKLVMEIDTDRAQRILWIRDPHRAPRGMPRRSDPEILAAEGEERAVGDGCQYATRAIERVTARDAVRLETHARAAPDLAHGGIECGDRRVALHQRIDMIDGVLYRVDRTRDARTVAAFAAPPAPRGSGHHRAELRPGARYCGRMRSATACQE